VVSADEGDLKPIHNETPRRRGFGVLGVSEEVAAHELNPFTKRRRDAEKPENLCVSASPVKVLS